MSTTLHASNGYCFYLFILLHTGAIPDSRDSNGHTVLRHLFRPYLEHFMHDRDIIECCMVLAQHGANINEHLSSSGDTPFHITAQFAARFELNDHVIKLLRMGGNPHIENWYYKLTPYEISKRSRDPSLKAVMDNYVCELREGEERKRRSWRGRRVRVYLLYTACHFKLCF